MRWFFVGLLAICVIAVTPQSSQRAHTRLFSVNSVVSLVDAVVTAQEINIAIGLGGRPAVRTLFDEIADARERAAFREVWDQKNPATQLPLGLRFVEAYPRSVVLREAYELIARAYLARGDLAAALQWAKYSIRLMPENPFLLVLIADTAMKVGEMDLAVDSARDALAYLEHAEPPSPIPAAQWPRVRAGVRANAYYVLGRVAAHRGEYRDAEHALLSALTLDPDDLDALYTLAVVRMAVGAEDGAARAFAQVARSGGSLAGRATESLRALYARRQGGDRLGFDEWMQSLKWNPPEPPPPVEKNQSSGGYAGSEMCRECHRSVYDNWRSTGMGRMFRPYNAAEVIGDFSGTQTISDSARAIIAGGKHFIEIRRGETSDWTRYPVDYLIGSKWQQAYATRLPDSRMLVFPIQYSRLRSSWVNYWKLVDAPGSPRTEINRFHEAPGEAVYQSACAPCHTSQLSFGKGASAPAAAVFREGGINCETCHGASLDHVQQRKTAVGPAGGARERAPVSFRRLPAQRYVAVCAQCHAQSAVHDAQPGGAVNYSEDGSTFRAYPMELPSSFSRKAFYRDGRYRATTFISEAFARSACFRKGSATCGSCHDPHPSNAASNPTSLKFAADSDQMCVQCHRAVGDRPERHTRHAAGTTASRCVSCHMPKIMEAVLFQARSHEIDDIPDGAMTARFGADDSPNACLDCHRDRDMTWLQSSLAAFQRTQ